MSNYITNPKEQLETLAAHQQHFERFLYELTGLTVKVALNVHTSSNSTTDLHNLFEASLTLLDFTQEKSSEHTWITCKDLNRHITIHMPEGFDADELYPEPEDLEGYAQAIVIANTHRMLSPEGKAIEAASRRAEGELTRNDDEIPF